MDPICHTLVGAALAGTRLGDRSWGARATLIVAANLPDVDVVALAWGQNASMTWRRGWTHGVLAIVVAPLLLAWLAGWWGRRRGHEVDQRWLIGLSYLGFLTHPTLDWLNTFGLRWLMPFDGTWFYGDALYIVDPWMWLILGGAAFLRFSSSRRALVSWAVLTALLSLPVLLFDTSLGTKVLWTAAIAVLAAVRHRGPVGPTAAHRVCAAALVLTTGYVVAMLALQQHAHETVVRETDRQAEEVFVGPLPARIASRDVLLIGQHDYTQGVYRIDRGLEIRDPVPIASDDSRVLAALLAPCAQGVVGWLRYPFFDIVELDELDELDGGGARVHLLDARYVRSAEPGFGMFTVGFDADGNIVECP